MDTNTANYEKINRRNITIVNIISLVLAVVMRYVSIIMATFASDSGPNTIAYTVYYSAQAIIPAVILTIIISQLLKSRTWMIIGVVIPFIPLSLLFIYAAIF